MAREDKEIKFVVGDPVINNTNNNRGTVIAINYFYGWYQVQYEDGFKRTYSANVRAKEAQCRIDLDAIIDRDLGSKYTPDKLVDIINTDKSFR